MLSLYFLNQYYYIDDCFASFCWVLRNKDIIIIFPIISKFDTAIPRVKDRVLAAVEVLMTCNDLIKNKYETKANEAIVRVTLNILSCV